MDTTELLHLTRARHLARSGEGKRLRQAAGLSLRETASALGIVATTLQNWEDGRRSPRGAPACRWAQFVTELNKAVQSQVPA